MRPVLQQKGSVSLVQSVVVPTDHVPRSSPAKGKQPEKPKMIVPATTMEKKSTSWCWGLLKWDSLPALPSVGNSNNGVSMSETERGWQLQQQRGRRRGPAFEHPSMFDIIVD